MKFNPQSLKLTLNFDVIKQLAIVDNPVSFVSDSNGLLSRRKSDDTQPYVAESDFLPEIQPLSSGPRYRIAASIEVSCCSEGGVPADGKL